MGTTIPQADGALGPRGVRTAVEWTAPGAARERAAALGAEHQAGRTEIVRNPHCDQDWAAEAVRSPRLLEAVQQVIGPAVAVENTFLVIKWPSRTFEVPWHQDGIDDRIELDPARSVAAWIALTDATERNGCLHVIAGSQRSGYLPYGPEAGTGQERGRADAADGVTGQGAVAVPTRAGCAVLMDVRLLHRSGSNLSDRARVGLNVRYVAPGGAVRRDLTCPSLDPISGTGW
jgi:ectoine hydroxylase-related dioxygenase (phytanoyl-CoA dioxygenase family)